MTSFTKLSDKEIEALTPQEKASYETALAKFTKAETDAKAKAEPKAKEEEKEAKTAKGWQTTDGTQFLTKNDADNHSASLPAEERGVEECTVTLV